MEKQQKNFMFFIDNFENGEDDEDDEDDEENDNYTFISIFELYFFICFRVSKYISNTV